MFTSDFHWLLWTEPDPSAGIKVESQHDHFLISPPSSPSPALSSPSCSSLSTSSSSLCHRRSPDPYRPRPYPSARGLHSIPTMSYSYTTKTNLRGPERRSSDGSGPIYHQDGMSNTNYPMPASYDWPSPLMSNQAQQYSPGSEYHISPSVVGGYDNSNVLNSMEHYDQPFSNTPHPNARSSQVTSSDHSSHSDVSSLQYRNCQLEESLRQCKERIRQLEAQHVRAPYTPPGSAGVTPPSSASFESSWKARTMARKRKFCSANRAGNALCAWHDTRRERRVYPPRNAPSGYLNCGCTDEEALFEESLARNGVGSYLPGDNVRMDPALRNPLLKLLQRRYGYRDGDFERDPRTGEWVTGEGHSKWEQESGPATNIRRSRSDRAR
ncbi:hypothetical protein E1B28_008361 [Marasmius oreades]|uniref:Uncharacterized protein n=1 Tax=Marasmius oreades TaxID=181124 RepID=A0A9P7RYX8_9AGAR|nr:uncharacterized protein E1B28_008361 [Marasmius oreades]KAG7091972.1 hypothetical protein E1B28_008361 [Marasmius oreades]